MRGFTLVEIIVVIAVVAIMSSIILLRIPNLRSKASVDTSVNTVLQAAREARNRASSVEQFNGEFPAYGVYFDTANQQQVIVYADCNLDDVDDDIFDGKDRFYYQPTECGGSSIKATFKLQRLARISAIRAVSATTQNSAKAYVEFVRPEPSVWLSQANTPSANPTLLPYGHIEVDISDLQGSFTKTVIFTPSGQISVKQ